MRRCGACVQESNRILGVNTAQWRQIDLQAQLQTTRLGTAVARIGQIATLSAATRKPAYQNSASRDLGVARQCSNVLGASLVKVEEMD